MISDEDSGLHLVELFLPLYGKDGAQVGRASFDRVREELTHRFGGVTAFVRSPAVGAWEGPDGEVARDDVVLFEVMVPTLDRTWWDGYRKALERQFRQDEVLVRASRIERL
jgi:hypothetical protein